MIRIPDVRHTSHPPSSGLKVHARHPSRLVDERSSMQEHFLITHALGREVA
jgi:hypothetical protein